jgi:8-oxo-dGDP phosphatase
MDRFDRKELKHAPVDAAGRLTAGGDTVATGQSARALRQPVLHNLRGRGLESGAPAAISTMGSLPFATGLSGILPLEPDGRVWLVGQHRYATDEFSWELPMGGVAPDMSLLDGAKKELKEETGLEADDWEPLLQRVHLSNSVTDEMGHGVPGARPERRQPWRRRPARNCGSSPPRCRMPWPPRWMGASLIRLTVAGLLALAVRAAEFGLDPSLFASAGEQADESRIPLLKTEMTPFPWWVDIDEPLLAARELMRQHKVRHLPVKAGGKLVSVITDRDLKFALDPDLGLPPRESLRVRDVCVYTGASSPRPTPAAPSRG